MVDPDAREHQTLENQLALEELRQAEYALARSAAEAADEQLRLQRLQLGELEAAAREANEANRAKTSYLARMSHEIRTPLHGIVAPSELLLKTDLDPQQRELAEIIRSSAELLLGVLDEVLDLSKIEANKLELESVPFDPATTTRDVMRLFMKRAAKKELDLSLDLVDVPQEVLGDPTRFRQIQVNLVSNAIKFTETGAVRLRLSGEESGGAAAIRLQVSDTGPGIPSELQELLFEPFTQRDASTSRLFGGTGLGLAITRWLVELMGGQIEIESEPELGTTFLVTIPFSLPSSEPEPPPDPVEDERPRRGQVLVVDDNRVSRVVLEALLRDAGYDSTVVSSGQEAIETVTRGGFDCVLMDCQMPGMNGYQATRALRAADLRIPVVALTASALRGERDRCLEAGMNDYLSKPIQRAGLIDVLDRWIKHD